jgi:hypothetical protein
MTKQVFFHVTTLGIILCAPFEASAQVNDNCSTGSYCVTAEYSGGGSGILAASSGTGYGVYASSTGAIGVYGQTGANSTSAAAGWFTTGAGSSSTAVVASNTSAGTGLYASSSSGYAGYFSGSVDVQGPFSVNGTCEYGCSSDRSLKQNIAPLTGALDTLLRLKGVTFDWKSPEDRGKNGAAKQTGFIAQEVESTFPQWVDEDKKGFKTLTIPSTEIGALEVESIRILKTENDALRMQTSKLEDRVKALESGRRPLLSGFNGVGFLGLGGLAVAAAVVSRRKREEEGAAK